MRFHNTKLKTLFILAAAVFCSFTSTVNAQSDQLPTNHYQPSISGSLSPSDSIRLLLDRYNISDKASRDKIRRQILNLAEKSNSSEVIYDVLKELSSETDEAGSLARLIEISESIQGVNHAQENINTVLIMEKAKANASDSNSQDAILNYMRQGMAMYADPYTEIQNIFRAMVYLGASSQGPLYFEYITRLNELVEALPESDHDIRNLFYTTAALFYTRKRDYQKAIEYDRKMIAELDKLKSYYSDPQAAANDLDYYYYVSYRRILRNFKGLTPEEVEEVFNKCVQLAQTDQRAAEEFNNNGLAHSYYYMATQQYAKAVPELQKALAVENISTFRKGELLGHLAFALRNTGDKENELIALREYSKMLLEDRTKKRDDMYREINLRNSVNKLIFEEYKDQESQREQNRVMRKTSITLVYVLAVILIFLCGAYLRLRRRVKTLETGNKNLRRNIEYIFDDGVPKGATDLHHSKSRLKG